MTRLPDYPITRSEVELQPDLQHTRRDDLLHASEVGGRHPRCVECGLAGEVLRQDAEIVLARARVQRVVNLRDQRRAVTAAEAETLFRSQRQEVERVRTVRSALLQRYRARALSERDVQSAIARQTGQRLEVRADRDAVRCLVTAEQLECMRLIVRTAALPDEIQDVIRIREIEAGGATDGRAARADASLNAVQPREHVGPLHLPSVRHA